MFEDLGFLQFCLLVPQPLYYVTCEFIKIMSDFSELYYPDKWAFLGQLIFIFVLYTPSFSLYYMNKRMIQTCIRRIHPYYDFTTNQLFVKREAPSPRNEEVGLLLNDSSPTDTIEEEVSRSSVLN